MKQRIVMGFVCTTAATSWLIWLLGAPASQDNSFRATAARIAIFAIIAVAAFLGTVLATVSLIVWRNCRLVTGAGLIVNIAGVLGCYLYFSIPNASTLIRAVASGDKERVESILDRGVNVDGLGRWGWDDLPGGTALLTATELGNAEIVRLLLDRGADPNRRHSGDESTTPLCTALAIHGRSEIARILLDAGANPNYRSAEVPLFWALQNGDLETARLLVYHGATVDAEVYERLLTWRGGRGANTLQAVEFLLAHGLDVDSSWRLDPFDRGMSPLLLAIEGGHADIVQFLVARGANVNLRPAISEPDYDWTPFPVGAAAKRGDIEMVESLLQAGADVNADHANPVSSIAPLIQAIEAGQYETAERLVEAGARPTPRMFRQLLFSRRHKSLEVVKPSLEFLFAHGLDPTAQNAQGNNELRAIAEKFQQPDVLQFLAERGILPRE
jgi:ankyrin repeat protein